MNTCLKIDNAIVIVLGKCEVLACSDEPSQITNTNFVNARAMSSELVDRIIAAVREGKSTND